MSRTTPSVRATCWTWIRHDTTSYAGYCAMGLPRKRERALEPLIVSKVDELLDPIIERGHGDFATEFAHRLPFFVVCELFGIPREDHGLFEDWFVRMVVRDPGKMAVQDDVWVAGEEMRVYLDEAVRKRRGQPRGDLLSSIAEAVSDGRMTAEEVVGMTRILLVAGVHTTETLIANSIHLLAPLPDERRALGQDP